MRVIFGIATLACLSWLAVAGPSAADPLIMIRPAKPPAPTIAPYGPGFDKGVILGRRKGCRNSVCAPKDYTNRPYHRRYYDRYFDLAKPEYSRTRKPAGNPAMDTSRPRPNR